MEATRETATEALHRRGEGRHSAAAFSGEGGGFEPVREEGYPPTVFYRWQKKFFENGAAAFQPRGRSNHQAEQDRIEYLEKKMQRKDEVLAELMEEHVALKRILGEL